ncbi:hypothetical protein [Bacillus thuringiensis]|uniref:hypothetical protein n=1 Tax=Bacillus thuringiensis TaxID=1428 RepID=UPI0011A84900|nr:hypothetical protein [Bacillus thuringiensis]
MECVGGWKRYVREFIEDVEVNGVTGSFFGNGEELGDEYGGYVGRSLEGKGVYYMGGLGGCGRVATECVVMVVRGKRGGGKWVGGNDISYE